MLNCFKMHHYLTSRLLVSTLILYSFFSVKQTYNIDKKPFPEAQQFMSRDSVLNLANFRRKILCDDTTDCKNLCYLQRLPRKYYDSECFEVVGTCEFRMCRCRCREDPCETELKRSKDAVN